MIWWVGTKAQQNAKKEEKKEEEYKLALQYLERLGSGKQASIQALDQQVLTLASAALTLSLTVVQLAPVRFVGLDGLRLAWILLLGSIGATILSMVLSALTYWYLFDAVRSAIEKGADWRRRRATLGRVVTRVLTAAGPLLFLAGMVYLATFTFTNLKAKAEGNEITQQQAVAGTSVPAISAH
jgi:hypothetical protein